MDRNRSAANTVPFPLESRRPIRQEMDFVQQDDRASLCLRRRFGLRPQTLPKSRQRRFWPVRGGINRRPAELARQLQKNCRLAHLPGTADQLNAPGCGLVQPFREQSPTGSAIQPEIFRKHTLIIIRVCFYFKLLRAAPAKRWHLADREYAD